jgi:hypothetical protein
VIARRTATSHDGHNVNIFQLPSPVLHQLRTVVLA